MVVVARVVAAAKEDVMKNKYVLLIMEINLVKRCIKYKVCAMCLGAGRPSTFDLRHFVLLSTHFCRVTAMHFPLINHRGPGSRKRKKLVCCLHNSFTGTA